MLPMPEMIHDLVKVLPAMVSLEEDRGDSQPTNGGMIAVKVNFYYYFLLQPWP